MYRLGLVDTLVTHATDRRGFMPPQLKTNKQEGSKLTVYFISTLGIKVTFCTFIDNFKGQFGQQQTLNLNKNIKRSPL